MSAETNSSLAAVPPLLSRPAATTSSCAKDSNGLGPASFSQRKLEAAEREAQTAINQLSDVSGAATERSAVKRITGNKRTSVAVTQSVPLAADDDAKVPASPLLTTLDASSAKTAADVPDLTARTPASSVASSLSVDRLTGSYTRKGYRSVAFGTWKVGSARTLLNTSKSNFELRAEEKLRATPQHGVLSGCATKRDKESGIFVDAEEARKEKLQMEANIPNGRINGVVNAKHINGHNYVTRRRFLESTGSPHTNTYSSHDFGLSNRTDPYFFHQTASASTVYNQTESGRMPRGDCFSSRDYIDYYQQPISQYRTAPMASSNDEDADMTASEEDLDDNVQHVLESFRQLQNYSSTRDSAQKNKTKHKKELGHHRTWLLNGRAGGNRLFGLARRTSGVTMKTTPDTRAPTVFGHRRSQSAGNEVALAVKPHSTYSHSPPPAPPTSALSNEEKWVPTDIYDQHKCNGSLSSYCTNSLTATKKFLHKIYSHPVKDVYDVEGNTTLNHACATQSMNHTGFDQSMNHTGYDQSMNHSIFDQSLNHAGFNQSMNNACVQSCDPMSVHVTLHSGPDVHVREYGQNGNISPSTPFVPAPQPTTGPISSGSSPLAKTDPTRQQWHLLYSHLKTEFSEMRRRDMDILSDLQRVEQSLSGYRQTASSASPVVKRHLDAAATPSPIVELAPRLEAQFSNQMQSSA